MLMEFKNCKMVAGDIALKFKGGFAEYRVSGYVTTSSDKVVTVYSKETNQPVLICNRDELESLIIYLK